MPPFHRPILTLVAVLGLTACVTPDASGGKGSEKRDAQVDTRDRSDATTGDVDADVDAEVDGGGGPHCPMDGNCTTPVAPVNECLEGLDDCDDLHAGCIDTATGFTCVCATGYEGSGHGAASCTEVGACGVDHGGCHTLAKCALYSGQVSCSCPPGYDGNGKGGDGCKDVDECAGGLYACGSGATACSNKVGSYECTCGGASVPTRDARSCKTDGWVGPELIAVDTEWVHPSRNWAVAMAPNDQNLITYVIDGTVFKSYVQGVGYEGRGTASPGPSREVRTGMDQAGNAFSLSVSRDAAAPEEKWGVWGARMVRNAGWMTPAAINPDQSGVSSAPALAVSSTGAAVAAWEQTESNRSSVFASYANLADGFGAPTPLEVQDENASQPQVALNALGAALAVWVEGAVGQRRVHASRYASGKWGADSAVPHSTAEDAERPQVVLDKSGCGYVVWREGNGDVKHIFGARYAPDKGFAKAQRLDTETASAGEPRAALDGTGNVTVVWSQGTQVFALRQGVCTGSSSVTKLDAKAAVDPAHVRVAESSSGDGFVVWLTTDATPWVSRRTAAGIWLEPKSLGVPVYSAEVAADDRGNAMVLYQLTRPWTIYAVRFEASP